MKIGYSKTYPITNSHNVLNGTWEKIWIEDEVTGTEEDARKALYALKKQVENFHYESNKAAEKEKVIIEEVPYFNGGATTKTAEERTVEQINEITDPKILKQFALLANNMATRYPKVKEAYDNRLKQLTI